MGARFEQTRTQEPPCSGGGPLTICLSIGNAALYVRAECNIASLSAEESAHCSQWVPQLALDIRKAETLRKVMLTGGLKIKAF